MPLRRVTTHVQEPLKRAGGEPPPQTDGAPKMTGFTVYVDDNYHYMDEDERWTLGVFGSAEEALSAAEDLVTKSVTAMYEAGMSASEVFGRYQMFGNDPFIVGVGFERRSFHAWDFARTESFRLFGTDLQCDARNVR